MKQQKDVNYSMNDPIVDSVLNRIRSRSEAGMKKYGVTMARTDVSTLQWLRHAQEEALDMAVYLERLIQDEITEAKERAYDAAAKELFP